MYHLCGYVFSNIYLPRIILLNVDTICCIQLYATFRKIGSLKFEINMGVQTQLFVSPMLVIKYSLKRLSCHINVMTLMRPLPLEQQGATGCNIGRGEGDFK